MALTRRSSHSPSRCRSASVNPSAPAAARAAWSRPAPGSAAPAAGVRRVLYTNHAGARPSSPFAPAVDHAATEAFLAAAGVSFTSLRHGFYAESALHLIGRGLQAGEIRAPEDGPVSWTARADFAEADAILLAREGRLDGITPPSTAPEAFTMADLAAIASELAGREIRRVTVSDEEWRRPVWRRAPPRRWRRCCSACIEPPGEATSPPSIRPCRRCSAAARKRCATCSPPRSRPLQTHLKELDSQGSALSGVPEAEPPALLCSPVDFQGSWYRFLPSKAVMPRQVLPAFTPALPTRATGAKPTLNSSGFWHIHLAYV